jgi:hypothetical protein
LATILPEFKNKSERDQKSGLKADKSIILIVKILEDDFSKCPLKNPKERSLL